MRIRAAPLAWVGLLLLAGAVGLGQTTVLITTPGSGSWTVPAGVLQITVECWGAGGAGGGFDSGLATGAGGGGGGGAYARRTFTVTPGQVIPYYVARPTIGRTGDGASGEATWFLANGPTGVVAAGGSGGLSNGTGGAGGSAAASYGDVVYPGGNGGSGSAGNYSGGGGGGAGSTGPGGNASGSTPGQGTSEYGGNGGAGRSTTGSGNSGSLYGGGGGGALKTSPGVGRDGGSGAPGLIRITYYSTVATIRVEKRVIGSAPPTAWEFTGTSPIGSFTLPAGGGSQDFTVPAGASYTISETPKAGYITAYRVDGGTPVSGNTVTVTPSAGQTIEVEFINVQEHCCVAFAGTLAFSAENKEAVEKPETLGSVSTQPLAFTVTTNIPAGCLFRLSFSSFQRVGGTEKLLTTMIYTFGASSGTIGDPPGYVDLLAGSGTTSGTLYLTVTRSGHNDPAGSYQASVTIKCLGDCTPRPGCLCEDTRTVAFTISTDCQLFSRGDLDFSGGNKADVEAPGHRDWVETNVLQFKLVTNILPGVALTVSGTRFEGTAGAAVTCGAKLPTQARSTWQKGGPADPEFLPLPAWGIDLPGTIRQEPNVGPGYYYGQVQLRVKRTGYNDPAGTYTARVTIVCSGF